MFYKKNINKLYIFLHHNYHTDSCSINKYEFDIKKIIDLKKIFIKNINNSNII